MHALHARNSLPTLLQKCGRVLPVELQQIKQLFWNFLVNRDAAVLRLEGLLEGEQRSKRGE